MHCTVRNNISHCFIGKLQEGFVYSMRDFTVKPNKEEYRIIKDATYMIELDGSTFVKKNRKRSWWLHQAPVSIHMPRGNTTYRKKVPHW